MRVSQSSVLLSVEIYNASFFLSWLLRLHTADRLTSKRVLTDS